MRTSDVDRWRRALTDGNVTVGRSALVALALPVFFVGMAVGYHGKSHRAAVAALTHSVPLPAHALRGPTTVRSTSTTVRVTTSVAPSGPAARLVVIWDDTSLGAATSPTFAVGKGPWNVGYAFDCSVEGSGALTLTLRQPDGSSATAPITATGRSGQQVARETSTGRFTIAVSSPCRWRVRVTAPSP